MTSYQEKKRFFDDVVTLYGRKPVLELLEDPQTVIFRLHLANSNAESPVMSRIEQLAVSRGIEMHQHTRRELSRISKNQRQDQGVAIDIQPPGFRQLSALFEPDRSMPDNNTREVILLDGVTNPQNLGLVIRSVAASPLTGLVLPRKGCAKIDPLVHKASAGILIRASIYHCPDAGGGIKLLKRKGFQIVGLSSAAELSLPQLPPAPGHRAWVLGNESSGISPSAQRLCDTLVAIPMRQGVDSINVAAAATLISFRGLLA